MNTDFDLNSYSAQMYNYNQQNTSQYNYADQIYPQRPDQPECPFFLKNGMCAYGSSCKFNHPPQVKSIPYEPATENRSGPLPRRFATACPFYLKTGICRYGMECRFDHPPLNAQTSEQQSTTGDFGNLFPEGFGLNMNLVDQSLPLNPGAPDCQFFLKTGNCSFGFKCRYNHPVERIGSMPVLAEDKSERMPCLYYMKTGNCRYGHACRFKHVLAGQVQEFKRQEDVEGMFMNLPRRPAASPCIFYLRTGKCAYGENCKFDHPDNRFLYAGMKYNTSMLQNNYSLMSNSMIPQDQVNNYSKF